MVLYGAGSGRGTSWSSSTPPTWPNEMAVPKSTEVTLVTLLHCAVVDGSRDDRDSSSTATVRYKVDADMVRPERDREEAVQCSGGIRCQRNE